MCAANVKHDGGKPRIYAVLLHRSAYLTGIATRNKRLQRGLVVEEKYLRVANYAKMMKREIEMIAHSCGLTNA